MMLAKEDPDFLNSVSAKVDWETAFFRLMVQIHESETPGIMKKNVELLECMLAPYWDDDYKKELDALFALFKEKVIEMRMQYKKGVPHDVGDIEEYLLVKSKYSALIRLAYRRNVLPQREIRPKKV